MHIHKDRIAAIRDHTREATGQRQRAPFLVIQALESLLNGESVPEASLTERRTDDVGTKWRVAWIVDGTVIFVEATSEVADWQFGANDTGKITAAWRLPLSSITGIELTSVSDLPSAGEVHAWESEQHFDFAVGQRLSLPLFGLPAADSDNVEAFTAVLRKSAGL